MELPKSHRKAFSELAALEPDERERIIDFLRGSAPTLNTLQLARGVADYAHINEDVALRIVTMISTMYRARIVSQSTAEEFASSVCSTVDPTPDFAIAEESIRAVRDFLSVVLGLEASLGVSARGRSLLFEQERFLTSARILTDFRPVFGEGPDVAPLAGVVLHKLKVEYDEEGEDKAFWVTLESGDLELFRDLVDRAIIKDRNLRTALADAVPCLD